MKNKEALIKRGLRLKEVLEVMGLSKQEEFADKIDVHQTTISLWLKGDRDMKDDYIDRIVILYNQITGKKLNRDWFKSGHGERDVIPKESEYNSYQLIQDLMKEKARLMDLLEKALTLNPNFPEDSKHEVPERKLWPAIRLAGNY